MVEQTDSDQARQNHTRLAAQLLAKGKAIPALIETWRAYEIVPDRPALRGAAQEAKFVSKLRLLVASTARGEAISMSVRNIVPLEQAERIQMFAAIFDAADRVKMVRPTKEDNSWRHEAESIGLKPDSMSGFLLGSASKPTFYTYTTDHQQLPFQREIIRSGSFEVDSPFSGEKVRSFHSLLVLEETPGGPLPHLFYYFKDIEPFFASVNPYTGDTSGLYFPLKNTIFDAQKKVYPKAVALLKALLAEFPSETLEYLSPAKKSTGLLYGSMYHLGHSMYEYEACHRCFSDHEGGGIKALITGPSNYLMARSLFPELDHLPDFRVTHTAQAYLVPLRENLILVRPTRPYYVSNGLRARFMMATGGSAPDADELAQAPLIWFELRTNDRYWVGQAEGIPKIITALHELYPDVGIILAGWSIPDDGLIYPGDRAMIAQDNALADAIKARIDPSIPVWNLTGLPTSAKVAWGKRCDAFVAVWSVGMVFPLHLGLRPGVIHVNTKFHSYIANPEYIEVEDCAPYYLIPPDKIRDDNSASDLTVQNHDVDWRDIFDALVQRCGLPAPRQ